MKKMKTIIYLKYSVHTKLRVVEKGIDGAVLKVSRDC